MRPPTDLQAGILLVAGEASGDLHGATLARGLAAQAPGLPLSGMGGPQMAAAGVRLLVDVTGRAAVGGTEALGSLPALVRAFRRLRSVIRAEPRPAAVVLIDLPEFNLRLARAARGAGVPVVYFMPPQVWAWRAGRIRSMRERVSLVLAALPFEVPLYRDAAVPVVFVGHPIVDTLAGAPGRDDARMRLGVSGGHPVIALLPGSRAQEIDRMLPVMTEAAARIAAVEPGARFVLALAPTVARATVERALGTGPRVEIAAGATATVLRAADVALVTSGTATLEAGLLGTPMVVGYRLSLVTDLLVAALVRVPWMSLVNVILGRAVVPELYRHLATGEAFAGEALRLLHAPGARAAQRDAFAELASLLGPPGVGERAAARVLATAGVAAAPPKRAAWSVP
jgi:lipid-A-disaccharide synthase